MTRPIAARAIAGAAVVAFLAGIWVASAALFPPLSWAAQSACVIFGVAAVTAVGTSLLHNVDTAGARFRTLRWKWSPSNVLLDAGRDQDSDGRLSLSGDIASAFTPGYIVYRFRDAAGRLLYVGVTGRDRPRSVAERLSEHVRDKHWADLIGGAHAVEWTAYPSYQAAAQAEQDQIRLHQPLYNQVRYTGAR